MTKKQLDANNEKSSLFLVNEFARDFFIKNLNNNSEGNKLDFLIYWKRYF